MSKAENPFIFTAALKGLEIQYPYPTADLSGFNKERLLTYIQRHPIEALSILYDGCKLVRDGFVNWNNSRPLVSYGYAEKNPACIGIAMIDDQQRVGLTHTGPNQDPGVHITALLSYFPDSMKISSLIIGTNINQITRTKAIMREEVPQVHIQVHAILDIWDDSIIALGIHPANRSVLMERERETGEKQINEIPFLPV